MPIPPVSQFATQVHYSRLIWAIVTDYLRCVFKKAVTFDTFVGRLTSFASVIML